MPRKKQPESEPLNHFGQTPRFSESSKLPGFDGPRPLLGFILQVLKGRDPGMIPFLLQWAPRTVHSLDTESFAGAHENPRFVAITQDAMIKTMKLVVDMWIDSGKSPLDNRVVAPADRNVQDIPPGHAISIHRLLQIGLLNEHPLWPSVSRDGKQHIVKRFPAFNNEKSASLGVRDMLDKYGKKVALYYFFELLNSPFPQHLSRCDNCKRYFAYERAVKRMITTGVFCDKCKSQGSVRRNIATRDRRLEKRVQLAADVWPQWKSESRQAPRSKWIAAKVNRALGCNEAHMTGRWVTQHETEIQNEIKRRKSNATRKN